MFYSTNLKSYSYHHRPTAHSKSRNYFLRHYRYYSSYKSSSFCSGNYSSNARHALHVKQALVESIYRASNFPLQDDCTIFTSKFLSRSSNDIPNRPDRSRSSYSNADSAESARVRNSVFKQYPHVLGNGRLPGGHPTCGDHAYSICSWYDDTTISSTSAFRSIDDFTHPSFPMHLSSSSSYHLSSVDPKYCSVLSFPLLGSLDMFNKLAYWFLFPIANDAEEISLYHAHETLAFHKNGFWTSFIIPPLQNLLKILKNDILHVEGSNSYSVIEGRKDPDHPPGVVKSTGPHENIERERQNTSSLSCTSPVPFIYEIMFSSISSIDSEEMSRQIEIESIARRLPVMIYGDHDQDEEANDSFKESNHEVISLESYDSFERIPSVTVPDKTSSSTSVQGLEWSWIAVPKDPIKSDPTEHKHMGTPRDNTLSSNILQEHDNQQQLPLHVHQCFICLERFQKGQKIKMLPCTHRFHLTCTERLNSSKHHSCFIGLCALTNAHPFLDDDDSIETMESLNLLNGEVPGICFARLGGQLAKIS